MLLRVDTIFLLELKMNLTNQTFSWNFSNISYIKPKITGMELE